MYAELTEWDNDFQQMIHEGILDRPDTCEPIVMTDAEADRAEMELAFANGWDPFGRMTATEWLASRETLVTT